VIVDPKLFGLFVVTGLALNVTPGPDMLYVLASGSRAGRRSGVVAALGIGLGSVVHTCAAATGVSALLVSSAAAFSAIKYAGAAYLVYVGIRALFAGDALPLAAGADAPRDERVFRRAVVTNVLNPKVAIFFLAFVPQFVDPGRGHVPLQFLLLGLTFCATGTAVNAGVGLAAGAVRRLLAERRGWARGLDRATGALFVGLGVRLALVRDR
jgi:threonine/homoserine/homoserine lactone efflux protein